MNLISRDLENLLQSHGQVGTTVNMTVSGGTLPPGVHNAGQINNINGSKGSLLHRYIKYRAKNLVFLGIVISLLLFSSLFTDMGLNIGGLILRWFGF